MTVLFPAVAGARCRAGAAFLLRTGRRTLAESVYLLTAPVTAAAGLLAVLAGLCVAAAGVLVPAPVAGRGRRPGPGAVGRRRRAVADGPGRLPS